MSTYKVEWLPAALRRLDRLDPQTQARILRKISTLTGDPRPSGVVKLAGSENLWRIRIGDYRVIYSLVDAVLVVTIIDVGHRRDIYRGR